MPRARNTEFLWKSWAEFFFLYDYDILYLAFCNTFYHFLQTQKKKIWDLVQPHLKTDDSCIAMLGVHLMRTSAGVIICRSLKNANIS